jgi:hypothetical protein
VVNYIYTGVYAESSFFDAVELRDLRLYVANKKFVVSGLSQLATERFAAVVGTIKSVAPSVFEGMVDLTYWEAQDDARITGPFLNFTKRVMTSFIEERFFMECLSRHPRFAVDLLREAYTSASKCVAEVEDK